MQIPCSFSSQEDILIVKVGNLLSEHTNQAVLRATESRLQEGYSRLVLDLTEVEYINSIGLNLLIILHKKLTEPGSGLVIAGASGKIREILETTRLLELFHLRTTLPEAVAALQN